MSDKRDDTVLAWLSYFNLMNTGKPGETYIPNSFLELDPITAYNTYIESQEELLSEN